MSIAKAKREGKRQLGQFLTPYSVARQIVDSLALNLEADVLEPSFGEGAFVQAYADRLAESGVDVAKWAQAHLHGCEIDPVAFGNFREAWRYGALPPGIAQGDFFRYEMPSFRVQEYFLRVEPKFDLIIGNPPFGGTIAADIQDELDAIYGFRHGCKIKKETYAFFIVKCLDLLKPGGRLVFICSDTLLSINTMSGLRKYLMDTCEVDISRMPGEFDETKQPMVVLSLVKGGRGVRVFGEAKPAEQIARTANSSWTITPDLAKYFTGETLGDYMTASSGMTVGKNEYFIREIENGAIVEPYSFVRVRRPITLARELEKARLGKISDSMRERIAEMEARGETEDSLDVMPREKPLVVKLPHPDYAPYNKSNSRIVYSPPTHMVYWRNDGADLYAYRKSGPWYLHGVGGKPYFKREGLTWQLISSRLNMRYLPEGYILDSGAPCAFLKKGVPRVEMLFIMGWCLTDLCNEILKKVINHTRNIQSKDFERLPYPTWVSPDDKARAVAAMRGILDRAMSGETFSRDSPEIRALGDMYIMSASPGKAGNVRHTVSQGCFAFAS